MRKLWCWMFVLALLAANFAAFRNLSVEPNRGRLKCIWLDLKESPGQTAWKLARAATGR
jgi:hypothetical protein